APDVLRPQAAQPRPAADVAGGRARAVAQVVAGDAGGEVAQVVAVLLQAEVRDVRAARAPGALERQRVPAGAAAVGQRAGAAGERGGQRVARRVLALVVAPVVVEAGRRLPVPGAARMRLQRDALHGVQQLLARDGEVAAAQRGRVGHAGDADL